MHTPPPPGFDDAPPPPPPIDSPEHGEIPPPPPEPPGAPPIAPGPPPPPGPTHTTVRQREPRSFSRFSDDISIEPSRGFKAAVEAAEMAQLAIKARVITLKVNSLHQNMLRESSLEGRQTIRQDRDQIIEDGLRTNPLFYPPPDWCPTSNKYSTKLPIPQEDHPETNFVGLLIGPRGESLKKLEAETGCKIMIRGKGSTKAGRGRVRPQAGDDEDLHVRLEADSQWALNKAATRIEQLLVPIPDDENEHKKTQLRMLAELNGTLKEDERQECLHCGQYDHRPWQCPHRKKTVAPWEKDLQAEVKVKPTLPNGESAMVQEEFDEFWKEVEALRNYYPDIQAPWQS
ncbi:hypothetical protein P9112_005877 [Eukaryota sp. TZLM1-RC]